MTWLWDAKNDDAKVNLSILSTQALHKISLRESVCTVRVCEVLLSLASTLIDLGVLANNAARALLLSSLVKSDNNMASAEDGITASAVLPVTDCQVGYRVTNGGFFSESAIRFFRSPNLQKNIPKNYPELEI